VPVEPLNDPADGRAVLSADGRTAFLASRRGGNADLWTATRIAADADLNAPLNLEALSDISLNVRFPQQAADASKAETPERSQEDGKHEKTGTIEEN